MEPFVDTFYGRPNTIRTYKSLFNNYILGIPPITNESEFQGQVRYWVGSGVAPNTIKILIRLLRKYIIHMGGPSIDTARFVSYAIKSRQKVPVQALNKEQANKLIDLSIGSFMEIPVALGLYAGLRRGECWGLMGEDINLGAKNITVSRSYNGPTKSGQTRIIPMAAPLYNILSPGYALSERVIDKIYDPNPILKKMCEGLKIPTITFHGLRHTFSTQALNSGRTPVEVSKILGHASVSTTIDLYWQCLKPMDVNIWD